MIKKQCVLYLLLMAFIVASCSGNPIYVDVEQQCVTTCNGKRIRLLYLTSADDKDFYIFELLYGKKGTATFDLRSINTNYSVEVLHGTLDLNHFQLRPEMEYTIEHRSNGDAYSGRVIIRTDKDGRIQYASKTSCK
jgi:hypothetical protein